MENPSIKSIKGYPHFKKPPKLRSRMSLAAISLGSDGYISKYREQIRYLNWVHLTRVRFMFM